MSRVKPIETFQIQIIKKYNKINSLKLIIETNYFLNVEKMLVLKLRPIRFNSPLPKVTKISGPNV